MAYPATTNYDSLDATKPLGSESPDQIDEVFRETRLVGKNTMKLAHNGAGNHLYATWKHNVIVDAPGVGTIDQWQRRPLNVISDLYGILSNGSFTNSIKPIAGTYKVSFWACGYKTDRFQARFAEAINNTLSPSGANPLTELLGSVGFADNAVNIVGYSHGVGYIITDGTKSYCLDQVNHIVNVTNGWGLGPFGATPSTSTNVAAVEFLKIG